MNLELLKVGEKVKYKTLCEAFGVKPATGNSKPKQLKDFECYVKMEKEGTWFHILEIYDTPMEKIDNRKNNGKHENSMKALKENRHTQESFFKEDELQLALLWLIANRGMKDKNYETIASAKFIPDELYVSLGLCNPNFKFLTREKSYYTKRSESGKGLYEQWQVNTAFYDVYNDMKKRTSTALAQLQRQGLLTFKYWKVYSDIEGNVFTFTDQQNKEFLVQRENAFQWWEETYPKRKVRNVGDIYSLLTTKEANEFEEKLMELLQETGLFDDIRYYSSCFIIDFDVRTIKRELEYRGFIVGTTDSEFDKAFGEIKPMVSAKVNAKFLERCHNKVDVQRDKQEKELRNFELELERFQEEQAKLLQERRGFGKSALLGVKEPKMPYTGLLDPEKSKETHELVDLGISEKQTREQKKLMKDINDFVKNTKRELAESKQSK